MSNNISNLSPDLQATVSDLVAAYVANNRVAVSDLPHLIESIHQSVMRLSSPVPAAPVETVAKPTAAQIRKSVQPDGIVSFLDGRSYKTLKRHLATHGLTPKTYRERFGLRDDYPMVAPSYSEHRSSLAKALGLGVRDGQGGRGRIVASAPKKRQKAA